ncbi:MAG: ATP-binding protein [Bacteroidaceae bacterium]|nr:ATP-binding protein [Bacteroidaceae bacterium]
MLIDRDLKEILLNIFNYLPVITLTGPRQSGKTTLCRKLFAELPYVNLEDAATLAEIEYDPKQFLSKFPSGVMIDEAQRFEKIFSYLQVMVDEDRMTDKKQHRFIVTGSSNFSLMQSASQSMAGRTAVLTLLPLSIKEIIKENFSVTTSQLILKGGYPALWKTADEGRQLLLSSYYTTYVERDLRQMINLKDLHAFHTFIRLCAGRIGSELNTSSLAIEIGVSVPTIKSWLSILEASYIIYLLPPYYANIGKRLTKSPKLYFYDTGLATWLMGINTIEQLDIHPLRGALFENVVINEAMKQKLNHGENPQLYFYRDQRQHEVDLLEEKPDGTLCAYEIKSSMTFRSDFFTQLSYIRKVLGEKIESTQVLYDGIQENAQSIDGFLNYRHAFL